MKLDWKSTTDENGQKAKWADLSPYMRVWIGWKGGTYVLCVGNRAVPDQFFEDANWTELCTGRSIKQLVTLSENINWTPYVGH